VRRRSLPLVALLLSLLLIAAACGGGDDDEPTSASADGADAAREGDALPAAELSLVAYSTPQEAYEELIEAFQDTPQGQNITFTQSYGGSGDQSRAVEAGLEADVVAFSLEPDMNRLVKANLVDAAWNTDDHAGMVTDSVVVLVVREGNPKGVEDWDDLLEDDIEVITPNPFTSGGARWNVMAAFGQITEGGGGTEEEGIEYLEQLFANVPVQDDSARKSLQTFTSGKGDVLLAYENEAIFAQEQGAPIEYIVPDSTILIENPIAVTKTSENAEQAQAFVDFVRGEEGQAIFAEHGYRPVVDGIESPFDFPEPSGLFTIADFGGWADVTATFFDPDGSIMASVEEKIGVSVG
jgi:sulfate/thiosulfate-binding protein